MATENPWDEYSRLASVVQPKAEFLALAICAAEDRKMITLPDWIRSAADEFRVAWDAMLAAAPELDNASSDR